MSSIFLVAVFFCFWPRSFLGRIAPLGLAVDAAYCFRRSSVVCRSVGLSVTTVRPAKAAEPIVMTFAMLTRVGPRNHVSDGVQTPPREGAPFRGWRWLFPHAAEHRSQWPWRRDFPACCRPWLASEAVECHIKFSSL